MSKTHQAVEGHRIVSEVIGLRSGNAECMIVQRKASNVEVVGDDVSLDGARAVSDLELLAGVDKRRGRLSSEERVVSLMRNCSVKRTKHDDVQNTYTASTCRRLALFAANPEIGRARIHEKLEITGRSTHLDSGDVANIVSPRQRQTMVFMC